MKKECKSCPFDGERREKIREIVNRLPESKIIEESAVVFKALGDPRRLQILNLLGERELCVYEVAEAMDQGMSTTSRQLKALYDAGLINRRREGNHHHYSLNKGVTSLLRLVEEHVGQQLMGAKP